MVTPETVSDYLRIFDEFDSSQWLDQALQRLHIESSAETCQRESTAFDRIASPCQDSLVLFGCGYLGRLVLQGLRLAGVTPVAFADNNPNRWGSSIEGIPILSPADALARYNHSSCFVVAVYRDSAVMEQLRASGCNRLSPVAPLLWKYPDFFIPSSGYELPHSILERDAEIRAAYATLSDDHSRRELCEQIVWRVTLEPDLLSSPEDESKIYFPDDLICPVAEEFFIDCGAFNGDSIRSFLRHRNFKFARIYGIEPDSGNLDSFRAWAAGLDRAVGSRITGLPHGVGNCDATLSFEMTNSMGSSFLAGASGSSIECRKLDTLFECESPTYIKMDVEGVEPEAIAGAANLIRSARPVLAVCVYHHCDHLWRIPALIHSIAPDYRLFVKRYAEDCWEMVCYGVPPERMAVV